MQSDGRAGEVHQTERSQPNAEGFARNGIDLGRICSPLFKQQAGFVEPRNEEAVYDKAGAVSANDDDFAQHFAVLHHLIDGGLTRGLGRDDLDQTVLGRVVEEMEANKSVRSPRCLRQCIHGQGGGVGGQNGLLAASSVKRRENGGLHVKVLEHRFNHKVGVGRRVLNADDAGDAPLDRLNLCWRENSSFNGLFEEVGDD